MYAATLKQGSTVEVYEDPMTRKRLEGRARLVRFQYRDEGLERWEVVFPDDPSFVCDRWIKVDD